MYKAVIFDMDGVIIDSEVIAVRYLEEALAEREIVLSKEEIAEMIGLSPKQGRQMLAKFCGEYEEIFASYEEKFDQQEIDLAGILNPGIRELLDFLMQNHLKIGLASSAYKKDIAEMLRQTGLEKYFTVVLSGEMFRESKPNPEIYIKTMRLLQVKAEECIIIEDSAYGIDAGKAAGAYVIAKEETRLPIDQRNADIILPDLRSIKDKIIQLTAV